MSQNITDQERLKYMNREKRDDRVRQLEEAGEIDTSTDRAQEILSQVRGRDLG